MTDLDRRSFVALLAAAGASVAVRDVPVSGQTDESYRLLVVGDSLIWGQGLEEKDKIYTHVAEWLRRDVLRSRRRVDVTVKAHSGATIRFDAKDAEKLRSRGKDEDYFYRGEVNISTPSMWKQVEVAADEYRAAGGSRGADMVLLTAGVTDIGVEGVLDPFGSNKKLLSLIEEICRGRVGALLEHISANNPDALIVVPGYFPMLSPHSSRSKIFNAWLEVSEVPGVVQSLANNGVMRPLVFRRLFNKAVERSRIWATESERNLKLAIEAHNARVGRPQAIFIPTPLTEEHSAEAPNTKLFRMSADGTTTDPVFAERKADCKVAYEELARSTGIKKSWRRCSIAAVGHPDEAGARFYADAVIRAVGPIVNS